MTARFCPEQLEGLSCHLLRCERRQVEQVWGEYQELSVGPVNLSCLLETHLGIDSGIEGGVTTVRADGM